MARGRGNDEEAKVPLSSLIDIVFLLIFFFVFTITVKNEQIDKSIDLAKSYHMDIAKGEKNQFTINVKASEDGPPSFSVGSKRYPLTVEQGGANSIEGLLRISKERNGDNVIVIIRSSKSLKFEYVQKINEVVGKAGLYKVRHHAEATSKD